MGLHSSSISDPRKGQYEKNKCHKKLRRLVGEALTDYAMLEKGDKVMVCLSGGKDSYTLLDLMLSFQKHAPINFEVVAVNLDQKQPGFPEEILPEYLDKMGVAHDIIEQDTYSIVKRLTPEGKTTCPVCSRLRRGILYNHAQKIGATKIALGHHADDVVETLLLNMFYGAKLKAMPAKLRSDDGRNILIRPLYYCRESLISQWSDHAQYPIIPCNLCGSQDNLQRQVIKEMLVGWDESNPGRVENIARSVNSVTLSHLGDRRHYDFEGLVAENRGVEAIEVEKRRIDITEVR
jgi:tRNA 2-thiocytidine biosynthesis protein TtcA